MQQHSHRMAEVYPVVPLIDMIATPLLGLTHYGRLHLTPKHLEHEQAYASVWGVASSCRLPGHKHRPVGMGDVEPAFHMELVLELHPTLSPGPDSPHRDSHPDSYRRRVELELREGRPAKRRATHHATPGPRQAGSREPYGHCWPQTAHL